MKPLKLIITLAAAICAVCNVHAQQPQTNIATFNATITVEGPIIRTATSISAGTKSTVLNTAGLITELGLATTNTFTTAAKLEVISGQNTNSQFAVSDGATFVLIPTNIMSISPTTGNSVIYGKLTSNTSLEKQLMVFELNFNDTGTAGSELQFSLRGIGSLSMLQTLSSTNTTARINLVGDGTIGLGPTNFVASAIITGVGKE